MEGGDLLRKFNKNSLWGAHRQKIWAGKQLKAPADIKRLTNARNIELNFQWTFVDCLLACLPLLTYLSIGKYHTQQCWNYNCEAAHDLLLLLARNFSSCKSEKLKLRIKFVSGASAMLLPAYETLQRYQISSHIHSIPVHSIFATSKCRKKEGVARAVKYRHTETDRNILS